MHQMGSLREAIKLPHGLSAHLTFGRKMPFGSRLLDTWYKDELQPLRIGHRVHGKCLGEMILLRPKRPWLPPAEMMQFRLDAGQLSQDDFRFGGHELDCIPVMGRQAVPCESRIDEALDRHTGFLSSGGKDSLG